MKSFTLSREYLPDCVKGIFKNDEKSYCTLERPWLNNDSAVSCIPEGTYLCKKTLTPHHGLVFQLQNVVNRSAILIHVGNYVHDSEGCILIGTGHGILNGENAVLHSKTGFDDFMAYMGDDDLELTIKLAE